MKRALPRARPVRAALLGTSLCQGGVTVEPMKG